MSGGPHSFWRPWWGGGVGWGPTVSLPVSDSSRWSYFSACGPFLRLHWPVECCSRRISPIAALLSPSRTYEDLCDYVGPTQVIRIIYLEILIIVTSADFLLPWHLPQSQSSEVTVWTSLRGHNPAYYSRDRLVMSARALIGVWGDTNTRHSPSLIWYLVTGRVG